MIIATPSPERARRSAGTGAIPTQRNVSPSQSPPVAQAPITALEGASGAAPVPIVPASPTRVAPAGTARPTRVLPGRAGPLRRRWPAAVGGLAAGLTLGTVGAMGAVFALSATSPAWSARPSTAPTAAQASLSPNVSVPGRVLTAFGDGT